MRRIQVTEGLSIDISHAGLNSEGLTNVNISIPLDAIKYLQGVNLIDCIKSGLLPDITSKLDAINQELTAADLELIRGWLETGIIHSGSTLSGYPDSIFLLSADDAMKGVISFIIGDAQPTYT